MRKKRAKRILLKRKRENIKPKVMSGFVLFFEPKNPEILQNEKSKTEKEKIDSAEEQVAKQKSKKKKIWNAIFFIINIVVVASVLTYQLIHENITSFSELKNLKFYYLPVLAGCFILVMGLDAYRTNLFLKSSGSRSRPYLCYKMCAIGKYYDNITPMSTGGEPAQIFYMKNRGLSASDSISVPMARYVVSQISWMLIGIVAVISIIFTGAMDVSVALVVGLVGFAANFTITSLSLLISMNKRLGNKLVRGVLNLLRKMKIVKNYDKQYERVMGTVEGYQTTMQTYAKRKFFFLYTILISIVIFVLTYTMPYIIYLMFGGTDYTLWGNMLVFGVIMELASSIIPIPGGSGMNEISFSVYFADIFPAGTVFWGLLFWRFMTYYIYILQGLAITIYDYFYGNKKYEWQSKKWELEKESQSFRDEQIKKFNKSKNKVGLDL